MPYTPPTLDELSRSIRAAMRAEMPGTDPFLWPNNLYVVGKVFAGALRGLHLRLGWIMAQSRVATAASEALDLHGGEIGITRAPATEAAGIVLCTGIAGTLLPQGTRLTRSDGKVFLTTAEATLYSDGAILNVIAEEAGKASNTEGGAGLELETPLAGIETLTVGGGGLRGGADIENDASLRERILTRKRNPPHGGSPSEYIAWAKQMAGVTRVYVRRATPAPGSVTILAMMDGLYADGIPTSADITALKALLEDLAPGNAAIVVRAPVALPVDVTITGLVPNTAAVKSAVTNELRAMFQRRAEPGLTGQPFTFSRSWISEAVSIATGEERHTLTLPAADIVCDEVGGVPQIATLGAVNWA